MWETAWYYPIHDAAMLRFRINLSICVLLTHCSVGPRTSRYMKGDLTFLSEKHANGERIVTYAINGVPTERYYYREGILKKGRSME